ncbi:uncharacterized protein [Triticum aestivum]|uniref:uncharacterized protein n=1 Tax=Triticum aestivum TaxID=4565 RepID=UPI001D00E74E|nr:uncharacterized protein LOC123121865 [Triticum aestivum]
MAGAGVGGRKARNFATFRLFPRDGAADPNDRVFVRVDNNAYTIPGFGDDEDPSLSPTAAADQFPSSTSGPLPDHVRQQILELGLPDDGYNYLLHLRELRPSAVASSFVPSHTARPEQLPLDVKAYDASKVRVASGKVEEELDEGRTMCKVAAKTAPVRRVEKAVDPDVARLLDESEDEGLEEDFVIMANQAEGDDMEDESEEEGGGVFSDVENDEEFEDEEGEPKPRVPRLLDEQFDLLALEEYGASDDDDGAVRDGEHELPTEVIDELKLFHNQNVCVDEEYRTPADFVRGKLDSTTAEEVDESANVIQKCAEYAERYLNETAEDEDVLLVSESSDESEVWDCETIVSTYSNLDNHPGKIQTPGNPKNRLPKVFPGETATTKDIIKLHGKEKLPVDYLPQRKRKVEKEKKAKPTESSDAEYFEKVVVQKETKDEKKARKVLDGLRVLVAKEVPRVVLEAAAGQPRRRPTSVLSAVKEEKREARKAKKELKELYKFETQKAQKVAAVTGPSSIRLMFAVIPAYEIVYESGNMTTERRWSWYLCRLGSVTADAQREQDTHTLVLPYVTKVLCCLLVATAIRLVKTLLLKVLASSFHVSTFFDRIQDALFNQYVIETLSGPPLVDENRMLAEVQRLQSAGANIPSDLQAAAMPSKAAAAPAQPKGARLTAAASRRGASKQLQRQKSDRHLEESSISIDQLHRLSQKNISAWSMKRLMKIVRYGALTTMDEQIKHATGPDQEDELATQIHSEYEAKVAAKRIFQNVAKPGSKHIYLSDLMRFMRQEEALKAMDLFEGAQEQNRVSKRSLKNWVVNAFRERKALALTLNDTKTAVNKLHHMANVVVALIVFALWLLILGFATTKTFVFLSSQLLVAAFIFGNTLKTIFEAIIFLFVMHPFDVGDRCEVDGMQVVVEEMNIMTTIFLRYDNLKVYYPNSKLATLPIMNYYRSPDMGDAVDFSVNVATPPEKLALMKERLMHYLDNKKEHWYPGSMVVLRDIDDTNRLKISIWCRHTINFQDMGMRFDRRELILQEMMKILRDLDIEYRMLPLDINVRNAPPINSTRMPTTWALNF